MKFSVWSSYYIELSPEDMVLEFAKNGIKYSELSDEHALALLERGDPFEIGEAFKKFAQLHGVSFLQGHLILKAKICDRHFVELLLRQLDLFRAIGIKSAVLHTDSSDYDGDNSLEAKRQNNVKAIQSLLERIKDTDMTICLENLCENAFNSSADDLLWFVEALKSPNLGICLDTGHLNLCDKDQAAFIVKCGKHLKALHLQDNEGTYDQHLMPFGKGQVNVIEVVKCAKEIGYDGLYNLEIPGETRCPAEIKTAKLEYLKKMFDYVDRVTNK